MRTITTLAAMLMATTATAESWTLEERGDWITYVTDEVQGGLTCIVVAMDTGGDYTLTVAYNETYKGSGLNLKYRHPTIVWGDGITSEIHMQVDERTNWRIPVVSVGGDILNVLDMPDSLIDDMRAGKGLYVDFEPDGNANIAFSLRGSAAAMAAYDDCSLKLGSY